MGTRTVVIPALWLGAAAACPTPRANVNSVTILKAEKSLWSFTEILPWNYLKRIRSITRFQPIFAGSVVEAGKIDISRAVFRASEWVRERAV
jgi:hypothetical protein